MDGGGETGENEAGEAHELKNLRSLEEKQNRHFDSQKRRCDCFEGC